MGLFKYARTKNDDDWYEEDTDDDEGLAESEICTCEHCGRTFVLGDAISNFHFCDLSYTDICSMQLLCEDCAVEEAEREYPTIDEI